MSAAPGWPWRLAGGHGMTGDVSRTIEDLNEGLFEHPELTERHSKVLLEALKLFAERGYKGASLRELARRVGVSQPSLYHYFSSKDELLGQVLEHLPYALVKTAPVGTMQIEDVAQAPRILTEMVRYLYTSTEWPLFVSFAFAIAAAKPELSAMFRRIFVEGTGRAALILFEKPIERGQISEQEALLLNKVCLSVITLDMLERKLLYPQLESDEAEERALLEYTVRLFEAGIAKVHPPR